MVYVPGWAFGKSSATGTLALSRTVNCSVLLAILPAGPVTIKSAMPSVWVPLGFVMSRFNINCSPGASSVLNRFKFADSIAWAGACARSSARAKIAISASVPNAAAKISGLICL